jgi:hypothetical protein
MAFDDVLPRNSESRALAIAFRLIRKNAPQVKWIISFADATQSGDGAIYRAVGFVLTAIKENDQIWEAPDGERAARLVKTNLNEGSGRDKYVDKYLTGSGARFSRTSLTDNRSHGQQAAARNAIVNRVTESKKIRHSLELRGICTPGAPERFGSARGASSMRPYIEAGFRPLPGFQVRYIYFLDPAYRARLTVPELPYSEIERRGAGMYRGQKRGTGETDSAPQTNVETEGASPIVPLIVEAP